MSYKENKSLDQRLELEEIENRCKKFWLENNVYAYDNTKSREETFIIDTPPPTVSGSLHIGHIFSYTQTDVIARYQRMHGKTVFYPIGWDDNGLPTERRVQNYYNITCNPELPYDASFKPEHKEDNSAPRREISRKNFIEACDKLTASDESIFEDVFKNIGHSYDWNLKYTTISPETIKISQESFIDLLEKKYIASVEAPTMWDVTFQSAVAQAEIEDREVQGFFHDIKFEVEGGQDSFIISTTRPELLPACIAIVAHPDDERYQKYFGKKAIVPLFDIEVDIVASEHAEKDKGTGIMMVCTFGDSADVAWWKKSGHPLKQIIGPDGRMLDIEYGQGVFTSKNPAKANQNYRQLVGLTTKQARAKIVELLAECGALQGELRPVTHMVKFYEKGNLPIEFVSSRQWFVKLLEQKDNLIKAGQQIKWKPAHMQRRYEEWANGLNQDWCISRQRFFGVPFPVWYKLDSHGYPDYDHPIIADRKQLPVDPMSDVPLNYTEEQRGKPNGFIGDKDVMDTWATSALTPEIAGNAALTDALLGVFERMHGFSSTAVLPYSQALVRFPAHLQQLDMESNGKSVNRFGEPVPYPTGPVLFGEPGTNGQHSFYQLLHQGTDTVPLQFIGFSENQGGLDLSIDGSTNQRKLNANLAAQITAFALGKDDDNPNKRFAGNRYSSLIYGRRLTPRALGALLAHFENKVMFQGFLWNLNSFDQEGVQLGKVLTKKVLGNDMSPELAAFDALLNG